MTANSSSNTKKTKIAVLLSGLGTNLQSIIDKKELGELDIEIVCVISNKEAAFGLTRAKKHKIPSYFVDPKGKSREEHEKEIAKILNKDNAELIILAGYMRLLSPWIIKKYKNKIINIHPSLLPAFPGADGYGDAWSYGVKVSGCTVHFVDEGCDTGLIILQKINLIKDVDTLESFKERGLKLEHEALPEAIKLYSKSKLKIEGRKVKIIK